MNSNSEEILLKEISEVSFALNDTILFLDTHPCDKEALEYYRKCRLLREEKVLEYINYYGPLTNEDVNTKNGWTWVQTPWPWEGVC